VVLIISGSNPSDDQTFLFTLFYRNSVKKPSFEVGKGKLAADRSEKFAAAKALNKNWIGKKKFWDCVKLKCTALWLMISHWFGSSQMWVNRSWVSSRILGFKN